MKLGSSAHLARKVFEGFRGKIIQTLGSYFILPLHGLPKCKQLELAPGSELPKLY